MSDSPRVQSGFLFAMPSFLSGFARLVDLRGFFDGYNISRSPAEADARAMFVDWSVAGDDVLTAARQLQHERSKQLKLFSRPRSA